MEYGREEKIENDENIRQRFKIERNWVRIEIFWMKNHPSNKVTEKSAGEKAENKLWKNIFSLSLQTPRESINIIGPIKPIFFFPFKFVDFAWPVQHVSSLFKIEF